MSKLKKALKKDWNIGAIEFVAYFQWLFKLIYIIVDKWIRKP